MILQVGVKVFLRNPDGKYLILQRSPEKYPEIDGDVWDIIGGRIEPGTPLVENLRREVREETHLELRGQPRLIAAQDILRSPEKHVVRLTYVAACAGEPTLDHDHVAWRWCDRQELLVLPNLDRYAKAVLEQGLLS